MNAVVLGRKIAARRGEVGLTQAELAARMVTTQSAISRIEAGRSLPSLLFLERFAQATGRPFELALGGQLPVPSPEERRGRVRRVMGSYRFDPWERGPGEAEARTLIADGLTRERFQSESASAARPR
jgi:transcriptional regulator with XRE-family HTH domain